MEQSLNMSTLHKCNTCKAVFSTLEKVKDHYKGDWHIFNAKRRSSGLASVCKEDFKLAKSKATIPKKVETLMINDGKDKIPCASPNSEIAVIMSSLSTTVAKDGFVLSSVRVSECDSPSDTISADVTDSILNLSSELAHDGLEGEDLDDVNEEGLDAVQSPLGPTVSIFDDKNFDTVGECVDYMASQFGFFIPDAEYLVDLNGLLEYLGEKVKVGGFCLYCQKRLRPGRPCQNHMMNKSHCKIAFEDGLDLEEFEDFYDYSSSYDDVDGGDEEDGGMQISPLGELVLRDGRTVGHRDFMRYYKQHYRPEDTRESVLAVQREELRRLGAEFGGQKVSSEELVSLSQVQMTAMIVKYHKEIRRGQMLEQRGAQRKDTLDQKRENRSKVEKARSSATTTAKIRDYHSIIM